MYLIHDQYLWEFQQSCFEPNGLEAQDPNNNSGFTPSNHANTVKPGGLEAKDPKNDFGFTPKIMQIP